jgi:hypothetical protein
VCMLEGQIVATGRAADMTREEVLNHYFGHHKTKIDTKNQTDTVA